MDRGNLGVGNKAVIAYMLQWGRDQLIAEMGWLLDAPNYDQLLQWSRNQSIAEIFGITEDAYRKRALQWGRDRSIAEMRTASSVSQSPT